MKMFTTPATLVLLAGLAVNAAPAPASNQVKPRQVLLVEATFFGAGPNPPFYTELIPGFGSSNICTSTHCLVPAGSQHCLDVS